MKKPLIIILLTLLGILLAAFALRSLFFALIILILGITLFLARKVRSVKKFCAISLAPIATIIVAIVVFYRIPVGGQVVFRDEIDHPMLDFSAFHDLLRGTVE